MENASVVKFVLILTATVALGLTGLRQVTKEQADINEDIFNKRAVLLAIENQMDKKVDDLSDEEVLNMFKEGGEIEQIAINVNGEALEGIMAEDIEMEKEKKKADEERAWPLFVYEKGGKKSYIVSVRGNGLWDEIWGNIAIAEDLNTVTGAAFDHRGETPGLGAEIKDNPSFRRQFKDKKLYRDGKYVSVKVRKGGARDKTYEVDGISGATVTADGVSDMLYKGIKYYEPYFNKIKK